MISSELIAGLSQELASERRLAAQEIGETGDPAAAAVLLIQLNNEKTRAVKEAILRGLAKIWSASPGAPMIALLRDADPFVRAEAAEMLQRRAGGAIEGLAAMMQDQDKDLRKFSLDIIGQSSAGLDNAILVQALNQALKDQDLNVVISAIENIGLSRRTVFRQAVLELVLGDAHPMTVCACLETLAIIGDRQTLDQVRVKFPQADMVPGIYLHSFLKLLGETGGEEVMDEVCAVLTSKGSTVYKAAIDALSRITARHKATVLPSSSEQTLCRLLTTDLDADVRYHLIRLLGHFARSLPVAISMLPGIHNPDKVLALLVVEALADSSEPGIEAALRSFFLEESITGAMSGNEVLEELGEILRRRPRWNLQPSSS